MAQVDVQYDTELGVLGSRPGMVGVMLQEPKRSVADSVPGGGCVRYLPH